MQPERFDELDKLIRTYIKNPEDNGWDNSHWSEIYHEEGLLIAKSFFVADFEELVTCWTKLPIWWKKHAITLFEPSPLNLKIFFESLNSDDEELAFFALRQISFWHDVTTRTYQQIKQMNIIKKIETISEESSENFQSEFKPFIDFIKKLDN